MFRVRNLPRAELFFTNLFSLVPFVRFRVPLEKIRLYIVSNDVHRRLRETFSSFFVVFLF